MKKISVNNNFLRVVFPFIVLVLVTFVGATLFDSFFSRILFLTLVLGIGGFVIKRIYNKTENVFYDNEFLYLKNKYHTRKIKLTNITGIKLTSSQQKILGFRFLKYQIGFKESNSTIDTVKFWVSSYSKSMSEFDKKIRYQVPTTKIKK